MTPACKEKVNGEVRELTIGAVLTETGGIIGQTED